MDYRGRRIVVMGLGRFGGGVGVTRFLASRGGRVLVTDSAAPQTLAASVAQLDGLDVELRLGEHREADFAAADMVVVNPAVKPGGNRFLEAAVDAGAELTSEIALLLRHLPSRRRVIGVTGTAGKSTVVAMLGHVVACCLGPGRVHTGGNLGGSLLMQLDRIGGDDWVVLELSSFMLERLRAETWSPHIAVVTNLSPNHLDWHGSFEAYIAAKQAILDHQQPGDVAILRGEALRHLRPAAGVRCLYEDNARSAASLSPLPLGEGPGVRAGSDGPPCVLPHPSPLPGGEGAKTAPEGEGAGPSSHPQIRLKVPGRHNRDNARTALAVAGAAGVDMQQAAEALAGFAGLAHRLQLVAEHAGVRYFNDSKSTTPESLARAIESFEPGRVHLILGGYDKGSDFAGLARRIAEHCRAAYSIGTTGPALAALIRRAGGEGQCLGRLEDAVAAAVARARPGQTVLLSPGCASWDQFDNFEQRGEAFITAVKHHAAGRS